jgi:pseudouridine-5'-phosphate glycosidase
MVSLPPYFTLSQDVAQARRDHTPILALESTVITHGLPRPENFALAIDLENEVRAQRVTPATTALLDKGWLKPG